MKRALTLTVLAAIAIIGTATPAYAHDVHIAADCDLITIQFVRFPDVLDNEATIDINGYAFLYRWHGPESEYIQATPMDVSTVTVLVTWAQGEAAASFDLTECQPPPPPPPPPPPTTTTTTTAPPEATTTTAPSASTTTVPGAVAPTTTSTVPPVVPVAASNELPRTGTGIGWWLTFGVVLIAAGALACGVTARLNRRS